MILSNRTRQLSLRAAPVRHAFTLIELLTVMAIIALLIGILTPALSQARKNGQKTAVRAMIKSMSDGCEMFKNEDTKQEYPKSSAWWHDPFPGNAQQDWEIGTAANPLTGAALIVDALAGRDGNGYDPKPTVNGGGAPQDDRWSSDTSAPRDRRGTYIAADRVTLADTTDHRPEDAYGQWSQTELDTQIIPVIDNLRARIFLDKWSFPILYYRANPRSSMNRPIGHVSGDPNPGVGSGIYDGRDNQVFTSHGPATTSGHIIRDAGDLPSYDALGRGDPQNNFIKAIMSTKSTTGIGTAQMFARPVNPETFIFWSPGPDGRFGNADDVHNIEAQ